jgi:putative ABC transport system permease protein
MWQSSITQGLAFAPMVLGVYLTFRVLNFADMTVDGSFTLGGAIAARLIIAGVNPVLSLFIAVIGGACAGTVTGLLHTRLKITELLSGILTMTALYSINLQVMNKAANLSLLRADTVIKGLRGLTSNPDTAKLVILLFFILISIGIKLLIDWFLHTEYGMALRATGDNEIMINGLGVNIDNTKLFGLALANGLVALCGGLVAQYQGFADIGMGVGTLVAGLAGIIIGEMIFGSPSVFRATLAAIGGSILYRIVIGVALNLGFDASNLRLVTAVLVVIALSVPKFKKLKIKKGSGTDA